MIHQQYNTFLLLKETVFFNFLTFLFDKELLHEYNIEVGYGDIAQSVRALASHARGRGFESSGPTTSLRTVYCSQRLFCKSHFSTHFLSQFLSESNYRWASIRFFYSDWGIFLSSLPRRCGFIVRSDFCKSHFTHSVAAPFPNRTRCRWASIPGFYSDWGIFFLLSLLRRCGFAYRCSDFCKSHFSNSFTRLFSESKSRCRWASIQHFILIGASFCQCFRVIAGMRYHLATAFSYLKQTPSLIHSVVSSHPAKPPALRGPQIRPHIACGMHFLQKLPARAFRCVSFSEKGRAAPSPLACKRARTASAYQPFSGHEDSGSPVISGKYLS